MFRFTVRGRRAGRIAFGAVLIAGAALLVHRLTSADYPQAAQVLLGAWSFAFAAYAIAGRLGSRRELDHVGELEAPGLVVPTVGVALLLPLTMHLPFAVGMSHDLKAFDNWAQLSLVITGPTHVVLAMLGGIRARQLAHGPASLTPAWIYGICVAVSCLPFAIFVLPPLLVAVTGLPLAALMSWTASLAAHERRLAPSQTLPRAIAVA
jgi:hypothetical protein